MWLKQFMKLDSQNQLNHQIVTKKKFSLYLSLSNNFEKALIHNSYLSTDLKYANQKVYSLTICRYFKFLRVILIIDNLKLTEKLPVDKNNLFLERFESNLSI